MEVEEEVASGKLGLKDLLDRDDIDADTVLACKMTADAEDNLKLEKPKNLRVGDTVGITGDISTLRECLKSKLEVERDMLDLRNGHGVLLALSNDIASVVVAAKNTVGLRTIEIKIEALRELKVTRETDMLSSDQGRTFDVAQELEAKARAQKSDDDGLTASDQELLDEEIPQQERNININEFWRYTVASDTISPTWLASRAKFIPLRLTLAERKVMRLVVNTMDVSEYTDKIDILSWRNKNRKIHKELTEICSILCGFVISTNYRAGQKLVQDKDFEDNEQFFQSAFEIARRYKVLNPEKMRTAYGKLVHVLMDSQTDEILELMNCRVVRPIQTVESYLKKHNAEDILTKHMGLILDATAEIDGAGKSRRQIDYEIHTKEANFKKLMRTCLREYPQLDDDDFERCMRSIGDNHNFLQWARSPCDKMIAWLKQGWDPRSPPADKRFNLGIRFGQGGARLNHSHSKQYQYVLQSLTLWREVLHEMFQLWYLAESDLLEQGNTYRLRDTGQGLNRIQRCPRIARAMRTIIGRIQQKCSGWVGSSVVHLGDHNVPNALVFIDKYNQVPRILNPIVITITNLNRLCQENQQISKFVISNYGDIETCQKYILTDFFRHGFDGSGADNFFDAGSCIDGRLTSAWNWCENIGKKPFYPIFQLTGFQTFDGEW